MLKKEYAEKGPKLQHEVGGEEGLGNKGGDPVRYPRSPSVGNWQLSLRP